VVDKQVDILIVGGGLTGAALMLALAQSGYSTLLVEALPVSDRVSADFDARTLALAPASVRILQMLNVWPLLAPHATAIATIHVSEQRRFGCTTLQGDEENPLGFVVEMQHIHQALQQLLSLQQVIAPAQLLAFDPVSGIAKINDGINELNIKVELVVAADGAQSSVRQLCALRADIKDYQQQAIVANIGLTRPHQNCAYERFTTAGPMALLPMSGLRASLVWSLPPQEAQDILTMDEREFLTTLQRAFGYRLGRFSKVGLRAVHVLRQVIMPQQVAWPVVFVGNAAHTLHPVAGQGFNLGLRDVAMLAQCIVQYGLNPGMLTTYQQLRHHDQGAVTRFTDGLVELFTSKLPGMGLARGLGLLALDNTALLKKLLARYARGYAGVTPDLVCGIPLQPKDSQ